jgi:O-antigen biosynthesis protein
MLRSRGWPGASEGIVIRPYVVWTPDYTPNSGGVKILHWFVHELNRLGHEAYVMWISGQPKTNPEWNEPTAPPTLEDFIAVYPDTVVGDPLNAPVVARWALNVPGRLPTMALVRGQWMQFPPGTPPMWGKNDLIFPFARGFNVWNLPEERILYVPIRELDVYRDLGRKRRGRMVFLGKGGFAGDFVRIPEIEKLPELKKSMTHDRKALAKILNKCELLYTYDTQTGLTDIARLCGCPVVLIPNEHTTREDIYEAETGADGLGWGLEETEKAIATVDAEAMHRRCEQLMQDFYRKLDTFIELTQAAEPAT